MFQYYQPTRIHFGENQLEELGKICKKYGEVCLLVTTPDVPLQALYGRVINILKQNGIGTVHFDQVKPNPSTQIVEEGFMKGSETLLTDKLQVQKPQATLYVTLPTEDCCSSLQDFQERHLQCIAVLIPITARRLLHCWYPQYLPLLWWASQSR